MHYSYILQCSDERYYIGSTKDIKQRLKDHNKGKIRFTKKRLPVKLIYLEKFSTLSEARRREFQIKGWKSRKMIEKLIKSFRGPIV